MHSKLLGLACALLPSSRPRDVMQCTRVEKNCGQQRQGEQHHEDQQRRASGHRRDRHVGGRVSDSSAYGAAYRRYRKHARKRTNSAFVVRHVGQRHHSGFMRAGAGATADGACTATAAARRRTRLGIKRKRPRQAVRVFCGLRSTKEKARHYVAGPFSFLHEPLISQARFSLYSLSGTGCFNGSKSAQRPCCQRPVARSIDTPPASRNTRAASS